MGELGLSFEDLYINNITFSFLVPFSQRCLNRARGVAGPIDKTEVSPRKYYCSNNVLLFSL